MKINVDGPGTGDGFVLFCKGETDISDASRPIKKAEADNCKAAGIDFIELKVGIDGLTVMTHPGNCAVTCLSLPRPLRPHRPRVARATRSGPTRQALAKELGSKVTYPGANLDVSARGRVRNLRQLRRAGHRTDRQEADGSRQDQGGPGEDHQARLLVLR